MKAICACKHSAEEHRPGFESDDFGDLEFAGFYCEACMCSDFVPIASDPLAQDSE